MGSFLKIKSFFISKLNMHSLKTKLILSILLLFLLLIFVLIANNVVAGIIIKQRINESILNSIQQTNNYLGLILNKAKETTFIIGKNKSLQDYTVANGLETKPYEEYAMINQLTNDICSSGEIISEINSIYVYVENKQKIITSNYGVYLYSDTAGCTWVKNALSINTPYKWTSSYFDERFSKKDMLSIILRADTINKNLNSRVYISANFEENVIYNILKNIKITPNSEVYLVDKNGNILSSQDKEYLGRSIMDKVNIDFNKIKENNSLRVKIKNKGYYRALYQQNPAVDWGILTLLPEREVLSQQRFFFNTVLVIILVISIVLIFVAYRVVVLYVDRPVAKLVKFMHQVEKGDFNGRIAETRMDEFGFLYESYNKMVYKLSNLIKELYQEKLLKRDAEIKVLQSQINPHFLYNTLETINWMANTNRVNEISKVVIALSGIYRTAFNRGRDFVTVREMIKTIENYLYIQRFRYGSRFDYTLNVDPESMNILVLNLILQPLVENAVIHGVGDMNRRSSISVDVTVEDNILGIRVTDSGSGMSREKLELLVKNINRQGTSGDSGLRNVHKRIQLFYGEKYGIEVQSELNKGTTIELNIPYYNYL